MSRPKVDYTLTVHEADDVGNYYIGCSEPGVILYGPHLDDLLGDAPEAVRKIRALNRKPDYVCQCAIARAIDRDAGRCLRCGLPLLNGVDP
jgi:hypothetical protein